MHFSLLPKYRGAAPVQWALMNGEEETGVTTLFMTEKLDAGPILMQKKVAIHEEDNAEILGNRLAVTGAQLLIETMDGLKSAEIEPIPQNERLATTAPSLKKEDGQIDWARKAMAILCQIRGMNPWPGTYTFLSGKRLKVHEAKLGSSKKSVSPGEVIMIGVEGLEVACGKDSLLLKQVQLEGGKKIEVTEFLKGHPLKIGEKLG